MYISGLFFLTVSTGYAALINYSQAIDTAGNRLEARADLATVFVRLALLPNNSGSNAPTENTPTKNIVDSLAELSLSDGQSIAIIDNSLRVVARLPAIFGSEPIQGVIINEIHTRRFIDSDSERHRVITDSPLDGQRRLYVFQRVDDTSYSVVVGEKTSVALQGWQQSLWAAGIGIILVAVIGIFFLKQFYRRVSVEVDLVNENRQRKSLQYEAQDNRARMQALVDSIPDLIFVFDKEGRFTFVHTTDETQLLINSTELVGYHYSEILPLELVSQFDGIRSEVERSKTTYQFDYQLKVNEELRVFDARVSVLPSIDGQQNGSLAVVRDVTQSRMHETELRIASTAFETHLGLMITDSAGVIIRANRAFTRITGYMEKEVIGRTPRILQSGLQDVEFYNQLWARVKEIGSWEGEIWNRRKSGEIFAEWLTITAVYSKSGTLQNYVGTFHDISKRKSAEREVHQLAFYDSLTGLANRALLEEKIEDVCAANNRQNTHAALLYLDIEKFRAVNDSRGYEVGDLVLKALSGRLASVVRESDTLARIGGDEFALLLTGLDATMDEAARSAERVADKILQVFSHPIDLKSQSIQITIGIGISILGGQRSQCSQQLQRAEQANQQAKERARSKDEKKIAFFDPEIQERVVHHVLLEEELKGALNARELLVFFQPQVNYHCDLLGYEVLLRWRHPQHGLVSPSVFIPIAEQTRLIVPIGLWVIEQACERLAAWQNDPSRNHLSLSVNVSIVQFQSDDFVDSVANILNETGAFPYLLKLEVTESLLMDDPERITEIMNRLRSIGILFSLDDFGTGYSSMSYLKRLPLDQIKIDQSFVREVTTSLASAAIVESTIGLAKGLGLEVIAEGVETAAQRDWLTDHGCLHFQGYLFGRPSENV